jgi:hypothetical protein
MIGEEERGQGQCGAWDKFIIKAKTHTPPTYMSKTMTVN